MSTRKLKLYVWEDVLCDYSCGLAVALAPDLETALAKVAEKAGYELDLGEPTKVVTDPEGFFVYGGG